MTGPYWLNGSLADAAAGQHCLSIADRGFTLADGVFETIRVVAGLPVRLPRHLTRLREGATLFGIVCPWPDAALAAACQAVLAAQIPSMPDAVLRITLTAGPAPRGLQPASVPRPTLLITAAPPPPPPAPIAAITARITRRNEHSPLARVKSLNYGDSLLALGEARRHGAQDAILLNSQGRVAEFTAATLAALVDGRLLTPPIRDGALPGIARAVLLQAGLLVESPLDSGHMAASRAVLAISSLAIRPLASLDGRALEPCPLLDALREAL